MDDNDTKEENQPSTSKKESQRTNSGNDLYDDRGHDERASNSESSVSATYSVRSRIDMADARPEVPKPIIGKREPKAPERKKRGRRATGRVVKRRRSYARRQVRRAPKRKPRPREDRKHQRDLSVSTIFTRLSSRSGSRTPGCIHCGHRCCRRRFQYIQRRFRARRYGIRHYHTYPNVRKKKIARVRRLKKKKVVKIVKPKPPAYASVCQHVQIGSRSQMLSPLFINTNSAPPEGEVPELLLPTHCPITPEMIHEALRNLTLWRQEVGTFVIMEYLRRNYPVNPTENALLIELKEKLRVAAIVGFVVQTNEDVWCLNSVLQRRKLAATHVSLFWQAYADTLNAFPFRKEPEPPKEKTEVQTNTAHGRSRYGDDLI
ncbi:uncharacterized protein LOC113502896 isoform X2 [Trichoplusia ni]|uniref:Uncharacterized protein LOC113502896 isoform X2 n=1 Tax=Trichoplusia ni TaxID=7111 RepID=A0A7E5WK00_TRINI|nr:uncharacterized protein LOC113502896 isoform X2 [Trichoplusia ni]